MDKDLMYLVKWIVSSQLFWGANYYVRSMKRQPHGGTGTSCGFLPNSRLKHYGVNTSRLFHNPVTVPFFLAALVEEAYCEYLKCEIDVNELCRFCFDDDLFWPVGARVLKPKTTYEEENKNVPIICTVISRGLAFTDYFEPEPRLLVFVLVCYLLHNGMLDIGGIPEILSHESLRIPHNKYGLSSVNTAEFLPQGFILDGQYYLYNIFLDTSTEKAFDNMPFTIKIITDEIPLGNLFLRCDEKLAVPADRKVSTATLDFIKFRGLTINFADIGNLVRKEETIVHCHLQLLDKLVMIIEPRMDQGGRVFYDFRIEGLWNPSRVLDSFVITNFVHSKYYPDKSSFGHIDFSVNQYPKIAFEEKYKDAVATTGIPMTKHADEHYKVWCVESDAIKVSTWSKLVLATLDEPFRELFIEMFCPHI